MDIILMSIDVFWKNNIWDELKYLMHEHTTSPDSNVQSGRSASTERSRVRRGNVDVRRAAGGGGDSGTSSIWAARCAEPPASRSLFHKDIVWMLSTRNLC
ncbi:hypothetical protein PV325_002085 [Microctonus aethiopoides]|nr:hypothetical protein PV325_002085 [Microctonus aethiopoides]